jgi:hypothetical protein
MDIIRCVEALESARQDRIDKRRELRKSQSEYLAPHWAFLEGLARQGEVRDLRREFKNDRLLFTFESGPVPGKFSLGVDIDSGANAPWTVVLLHGDQELAEVSGSAAGEPSVAVGLKHLSEAIGRMQASYTDI